MVACAVATSAAHPSSSVVGGGERRAPVASPEVSRAALAPPKAGSMAVTTAATIDQLKQQLTTAIDNKDSEKATSAIDELERVNLTREILESTRIGLFVNQARKQINEVWPPLAKRCRGLIKAWQRLVELAKILRNRAASGDGCPTTNSSSASTSRNGTPSLVSPAVGRRLTPHTPANRRITPGIASERASNLSPSANGSYAPKMGNMLSPGLGMHKSHSVGFDLKDENGVRNGKRKQDEPVPGIAPSSIKRAKTTASGLSAAGAMTSPAPPATPSLIETRRAAVQSTSDLVAQLTSNLPQHLGFEDAAKAHEEKVKREMEDQQLAAAIANGGEPTQSPYVFDKKRKYERKKPLTGVPSTPSLQHASASSSTSSTTTVRIVTPPAEGGKGGLVLKLSLSRPTTDAGSLAQQAATPATGLDKREEKERRKREKKEAAALHASKSAPALALLDGASTSGAAGGPSTSAATAAWLQQQQQAMTSSSSAASSMDGGSGEKKKEKIDWFAMVPSIAELQARAEKDKERRKILAGITDSEKAYTLHVGEGRIVLALPYIEIEDRPDFLKFNYPDPGRFYAEENFIGGLMERPVHPAPAAPAAAPTAAAQK